MNNKIYQYKKKCFIKIKSIQIMRKKMSIKIEYKKMIPFYIASTKTQTDPHNLCKDKSCVMCTCLISAKLQIDLTCVNSSLVNVYLSM